MTIYNMTISSTALGIEDHGIMTFMLHLRGDSIGIGYGGYALDRKIDGQIVASGSGHGYQAIREILTTIKVNSWEELKGKLCRIEFNDGPGMSGKISRIGHIIEDRWFDLANYMKSEVE